MGKHSGQEKRDHQRSKVYAAEDKIFEKVPEFTTMDECNAFVDSLKNSEHWKRFNGYNRIKLHCGAGNRSATWCFRTKTIKLPLWSRSRWVMCHELAHALKDATNGCKSPAHGSAFCRHYVELVRHNISNEDAERLERSFIDDGVSLMKVTDLKPR